MVDADAKKPKGKKSRLDGGKPRDRPLETNGAYIRNGP